MQHLSLRLIIFAYPWLSIVYFSKLELCQITYKETFYWGHLIGANYSPDGFGLRNKRILDRNLPDSIVVAMAIKAKYLGLKCRPFGIGIFNTLD